jgi:hypothetical protein
VDDASRQRDEPRHRTRSAPDILAATPTVLATPSNRHYEASLIGRLTISPEKEKELMRLKKAMLNRPRPAGPAPSAAQAAYVVDGSGGVQPVSRKPWDGRPHVAIPYECRGLRPGCKIYTEPWAEEAHDTWSSPAGGEGFTLLHQPGSGSVSRFLSATDVPLTYQQAQAAAAQATIAQAAEKEAAAAAREERATAKEEAAAARERRAAAKEEAAAAREEAAERLVRDAAATVEAVAAREAGVAAREAQAAVVAIAQAPEAARRPSWS